MRKYFLFYYMILMFGLVAFATTANSQELDNLRTLKLKLAVIDIKVSNTVLSEISIGLRSCNIPENLVLSIIKKESSFRVGAYNKSSKDYGLMQINSWHVKRLKLDRNKLLTDVVYNMKHGCNILEWFYKTYNLRESIGRYNCGTRKECIKYKAVKFYVRNVLAYKTRMDSVDKLCNKE